MASTFGEELTGNCYLKRGLRVHRHHSRFDKAQPLAVASAPALSGGMDTDMTKNDGQMPEQPSDAKDPSPNQGEQNPPIQPPDEPWSKQ